MLDIITARKRSLVEGNVFSTYLSVVLFTGGGGVMMSLPVMDSITVPENTTLWTASPFWTAPPPTDNTPSWTAPPAQHHPLPSQQVVGRHPNGMLSCFIIFQDNKMLTSRAVFNAHDANTILHLQSCILCRNSL